VPVKWSRNEVKEKEFIPYVTVKVSVVTSNNVKFICCLSATYWTSKTRGFQSVCPSFLSACGPSLILRSWIVVPQQHLLARQHLIEKELLKLWPSSNTDCLVVCRMQILFETIVWRAVLFLGLKNESSSSSWWWYQSSRQYSRPVAEGMTFGAKLLVTIDVFHLVTK